MYCNLCQKQFNPWCTFYGWGHHENCTSCHDKIWSKGFRHKDVDHYCINCGGTLPMHLRSSKTGKFFTSLTTSKLCDNCKEIIFGSQEPVIRKCIVCGIEIGRSIKYCPDHKPKSNKIYPIANRRSSLSWQKNNPKKVNAAVFALTHPHEVYVLYECRCDHLKKHNHHFNYELKNIVIRLCPACHAAEHARLRSLHPALAEAI